MPVIGFEKEDEQQEFALGKLLWLKTHPKHPDGNLKGYRRLKFYRRRQAKYGTLRRQLVEAVYASSTGELDENAMLVREILTLLPMAKKQLALRALASGDGRSILAAASHIRKVLGRWIERHQQEWSL